MLESNSLVLEEIAEFLDRFFAIERYPQEERGGVYLPSTRPIRRLGLALEPWTQLQEWVNAQKLDALFLHRPWKLQPGELSPDVGIVSYHLAFDERLTFSFNPELAQVLGMFDIFVLGEKDTRPIGMIGEIPAQSFSSLLRRINYVFAGYEEISKVDNYDEVTRVAVVGAMTDLLVREAANRGAHVYITGQLRKPAQQALLDTKLSAIALGHRRGEAWGLRSLAVVLQERWSGLQVVPYNE